MAFDDDEETYRERTRTGVFVGSVLRVTLLFGSLAVVAIALAASQFLDGRINHYFAESDVAPGIDRMSTGSIGYNGTYTVRRSVLQSSPSAVCVVRDNGTRSGDC